MAATGRDAPTQSATADREIVISRVISAPRELVFEAFTEVRHLSRWWGPEGFTTTTRAFEFRVGGEWDFVMHGPDGTDYQEWISWTEIAPPERIALLHGESRGDPNAFEAREATGDRDIRIAGGGATILEYVNAGLIDEFAIALSPVLFGSGIRLFEGVDAGRVALEPVRAEPTQRVTHLTYAVRER
ncbi:SRPBCC domain-containing protein [Trebonia sp.]|uniref:SRPBCC domain-containing protein n=1 Tax=Trebonia sp. TaxID=2767075 RepID=UPI003BAEDC99